MRPHLTPEQIIDQFGYLVLDDGLHCGVEPTGGEVLDYLEANPIPGVKLYRCYPEAVKKGARFLASHEIGGWFTDEVVDADIRTLDKDQRAARRFVNKMSQINTWLGIDIHDSPNKNANSLVIGSNIDALHIGAAAIFGINRVVILEGYPFFSMLDNFITIETERDPVNNHLSKPEFWHMWVTDLMDHGPETLVDLGYEMNKDFEYYVKYEILRVDEYGRPDPERIRLIDALQELPHPGPYFTHIDFELPGLEEIGDDLYVGYWGDENNNSQELTELKPREDGTYPKQAFASVMKRIDPVELPKVA